MYQHFIGLEIHVQLKSESKVFCSCTNHFGDEPNSNICPVCMGLPGTLPALNEEAMKKSYALARALNCELASVCAFERKNYFYPDLPKNYQISQFERPLGKNGHIDIALEGLQKRIRIRECHLEEDAGKMIHAGDISLLDYNRTGTPLLEIVTEPDLVMADEAEVLVLELRRLVRYMNLSDGNMEEGSLRADANISINHTGKGLGNKVEIKNLNSSRFIKKCLNFEIKRQEAVLDSGDTVVQETRFWNENRDQTENMRTKENANDYRYFPEPDLRPFYTNAEFLHDIEALQIELPFARRERYCRDYALSTAQATFICEEKSTADYFEDCVNMGADPLMLATWIGSDVQKELKALNSDLASSPLTTRRLVDLLNLLQSGRIHGKIAKQVIKAIFQENKDPESIIKEKNWEQITDTNEIEALVQSVLEENPQALAELRAGDKKPLAFLMGKVMQKSSGRIEPQRAQRQLEAAVARDSQHAGAGVGTRAGAGAGMGTSASTRSETGAGVEDR